MCRKMIYLISLVLVLSFASMSWGVTVDLNTGLAAWWTFDEGSGTVAFDGSGNNNHATLMGGATWTTQVAPGKSGSAISLNGTNAYLQIEHSPSLDIYNAVTFEMWIWGGGTPVRQLISKGTDGNAWRRYYSIRLDEDAPTYRTLDWRDRQGSTPNSLNTRTPIPAAEWIHVAVTFDINAPGNNQKWYINGKLDAENRSVEPLWRNTGDVYICCDGYGRWYWQGMIDDGSLYNRALNPVEIKVIAGVKDTTDPSPKDGSTISTTSVLLEWWQGSNVAATNGHHVYFSDSFADVNDGAASADKGFTTETSFAVSNLIPGTTYYWRVNEVNDVHPDKLWRGDVWSFIVAGGKASVPNPYDGATYVGMKRVLEWAQGTGALSHHIYFGKDQTKVTGGHSDVDKGIVAEPNYTPPETLSGDATYYWRVDEFDGTTTHTGDVWSFQTTPSTDPNLIGWWTFDDIGYGELPVLDISGNELHGRFIFNANIITVSNRPYASQTNVLNLNGTNECVYVPYTPILDLTRAVTVALWAYGGTGSDRALSKGGAASARTDSYTFRLDGSANRRIQFHYGGPTLLSTSSFPTAEWTHIAITFDVNAPDNNQKMYFNGVLDAENRSTALLTTNLYYLAIGGREGAGGMWGGMLDDVRIYNRALTAPEVKIVMTGDPNLATDPVPANGATPDIEHAMTLSWTRGANAALHDVYLGTDAGAVQNATPVEPMSVYMGRHATASFTLSAALQPGQTYYWRIDEVNDLHPKSPWKGSVWSFTVANYLVVDDFESYDNLDNRIYNVWADYAANNTGMTVGHFDPPFAERTIVHSGTQAMYMHYDNDGAVNEGTSLEKTGTKFYSEADREWQASQDWTRNGVNSLTLWFRGIPASVGSFTAGPPIYTMTAAGADIWGTSDQFHFAYKQLSGYNGSITAKVLSITNTHDYAKAGVMIRETLAANSKHADVVFSPIGRVAFERRTIEGAASESTSQTGVAAPYWVRLTRTGNSFIAEHSANGTTWTALGTPVTIPMLNDVYIGLCLTSHNVNATCTAEFSDVTTTGIVTGDWQSQDIGIASNQASQLYVALADSAGNTATVKHPDPAATTIATWTEWPIDQASFTGVNLQAIKKMIIGAGDRASPLRGGAGDLYIDDIRLRFPAPQQ